MKFSKDILSAIGNTPLVKLNKILEENSANVFAKCEFMNPTGSIKDRMALHIIEEAEKSGKIKPGGTIVENTSGNTGLGVAMVAAVKGYRCVFTMPDKMSTEKVNMLKAYGAEVVITPTDVPADSPEHYVETAKRIARERPGSFYVNQYHNQLNIDAHYHSTGKEIWEQTEGKIDIFVAGIGTGGTISGVGRYLKERNPDIRIVGVDPIGSVFFNYFYTKQMPTPHVYKVEGIGEDLLCEAVDFSVIDEIRQVNDKQSFLMARKLIRQEGFFCGGSSGSSMHIAAEVAKEVGPGKTIVAVLTDSASRYITKYLSDSWMQDNGFLESRPDLGLVEDLLVSRNQKLVTVKKNAKVSQVIELLKTNQISQVPVVDDYNSPSFIIHEIDVLRALQSGKVKPDSTIDEIQNPTAGVISPKARIEELYKIFENDQVAIVVDNGKLSGIVSKIDLIDYISRQ